MRKELFPSKNIGGVISVPGDKSITHRAILLSVLSEGEITVKNYADNSDCRASIKAVETLGVKVEIRGSELTLIPPDTLSLEDGTVIDCGNSATTARLLSGIIAGSNLTATIGGDESLSRRPMDRVISPLSQMGAEVFSEDSHLPVRIVGKTLLPFQYDLPVPSAQVKSAILLAGLASRCSVTVREKVVTRDHTERLLDDIGTGVDVHEVKPVMIADPVDPRKKRMKMPESFRKEISLPSQAKILGGTVTVPGDISTAAFFMAAAAISKKTITVENVGLNPTRTGILEHLKACGCSVGIEDRQVVSGEPRGTVKVTGVELRPRKISGDTIASIIDEIPVIAIIAAFTEGTTIIRDASELRLKESNRLESVAANLELMGIKCGLLEDGIVIEGGRDLSGADFKSFGDHRIAMAFSIASLFLVGPSSIDDASVVDISCPDFYKILEQVAS
ncbi:MAG: 3-phosphoshikimate 1-carboxyvinyltransferase [Candidatus Zixiibacteriota bacterium]|nr:MAG: 3-phosphoshikimate 1-carboxyvinyltransferase [candidate division Zixibacteria bacterium]